MTALQYLMSTKVCTTAELIALKKEDPDGYSRLIQMGREQAAHQNIPLES